MGRSCVSRPVSNELIKSRSSETAESSIIIRSAVIADREVNGTGFSNFGSGRRAVWRAGEELLAASISSLSDNEAPRRNHRLLRLSPSPRLLRALVINRDISPPTNEFADAATCTRTCATVSARVRATRQRGPALRRPLYRRRIVSARSRSAPKYLRISSPRLFAGRAARGGFDTAAHVCKYVQMRGCVLTSVS